MDKDTERELNRVDHKLNEIEQAQKEQGKVLQKLARDILRFWHLGVGVGLGLILKEVGLEKLLGKLL